MWGPIPEEYQGIMLEETPVMHPEEKREYYKPEPEKAYGVYHTCYICGSGLGNLAADYKVCKIYSREPTKYDERKGKYALSYCIWCYNVHCK